MNKLNRIITEAIDEVVMEKAKNDAMKHGSKRHKFHSGSKKFYYDEDDDDDGEKKRFKKKKVTHGSDKEYDYKEYKRKNKPVSKADASSISSVIDMDRTNISDVAQEIYPNHTKEGAQSQLLKVLNLERKMPVWVYNRLSDMISSGQIATK